MSVQSVSANYIPNKLEKPVKKESHAIRYGALLGAGASATLTGISLIKNKKEISNALKILEKAEKTAAVRKMVIGVIIAAAVWGAIGAGIGAIVKACKKDK